MIGMPGKPPSPTAAFLDREAEDWPCGTDGRQDASDILRRWDERL